MDSGEGPFQNMLTSLRQTFNKRLPAGLTPSADTRLQRTLNHYVREVLRVHGSFDEQEILRETFDSMAGWFRRNTDQLVPGAAVFKPVRPAAGSPVVPVAPSPAADAFETTEDPIALFERLKAARTGALPFLPPEPSPKGIPELIAIDTRPPQAVEGVPHGVFGSTPLSALGSTPLGALGSTPLGALGSTPLGALGSQPKDFIIRQEDVVKYREMEYNLVLNSKDRDWLNSSNENRYRFTVQLNGGFIPQGTGIQPTIQNRLRNIVRIEFIKAILPVEGLDVAVPRSCSTTSDKTAIPESAFLSSLALPYVQVLMDEFQGNNTVGTNETVDRALAICQYDSTWKSDPTHVVTTNRGYTLFFPKLMKAQRVYTPTPLANLQSLSFHMLNPENLPLSTVPDSFAVERIVYSHLDDISGSCYSDYVSPGGTADTADYLFIKMKKWFPLWAFSKMDRVTFNGLTFTSTTAGVQAGGEALNTWLEKPEGHVVVGIASNVGETMRIQDGANDCGYANWIVIRNRFKDPTAGMCSRALFASNLSLEDDLAEELAVYDTTGYQRGGALNLSRQVQVFLRVITREVDPASGVRPDNV
jgi:hypothetical protein